MMEQDIQSSWILILTLKEANLMDPLISEGTSLYGMTSAGGTNNLGTIFKINPDGTGYTKLLDFAGASNGGDPRGSLISDGTSLYGMTLSGGTNSMGTIFKINPDGSSYTKLLDFAGASNGRNPWGSLISDGTSLYGMTSAGGTNNLGTIFKINPDGTGYTKLLDFAGASNGGDPRGSLISDGTSLYGMTRTGGANNLGTIFKINPDGTGYTKLLDFAGASNGSVPRGSLISDGTSLYGMTTGGGTNNLGTIFKINPDGTGYTKLLDFAGTTNGRDPFGDLVSDGTSLYGMTIQGGTNASGTLFKINLDGTGYTKLMDFVYSNGSRPWGSLISDGTSLYGMTWGGGSANLGTVFKYCIPPIADAPSNVAACDSYILPALTVGNYYTATNGGGTPLSAGANITSTQTLYVYATNGSCSDEKNFTVTITNSTTNTTTASSCDSYTWSENGQTYTASGTYTVVTGCHTEELVLTITNSTTNTTTASSCDSYTWSENGQTYTASGTYTVVTGCHTEELVLTITNSTTNTTTASSCDTYTWSENGQTYTASGTYTVVTGCHTEELVLTITNSTTNTTTASSCDSYTWSENGQTYTASGTYTVVTGCHTEELVLTITNSTTNTTTASSCDTYTWSENGQTYTASGTYTVVTGCHTEELVLTITNSTTNTTTASSCDTYTWSENGQTYTASGTYTVVTGCHTEELVLTITNSTTNTTTASSCDTYTWSENGQTYTASGTYTVVTGCHTEELVLTITNSTTNTTTASSCDTYTWSENGQTYTASGTYTVVTGCHTEELVLTITNSTTNITTASSCDSYTWSENGQTYTASGYTVVTGCHTEELVLTTASSCDTYTWSENGQTYTASGTYTVVTGCHTEELVLTINSVSDLSTSLTGETITANNNNATYQWLDCDNGNAPIAGATGQSFTATSNGSYAVEITENGCVSNSICTTVSSTSIEDLENSYEITIFPNPTNRAIRIALPDVLLGQTMVLTNGVGQILQTTTITSTSVEYDLSNLADGIYFVQVQTHSGVITKKIVKN
jgi:uncharacterized repeat protein (TIGR03803 family)